MVDVFLIIKRSRRMHDSGMKLSSTGYGQQQREALLDGGQTTAA
jgi:hypothetical protein